MVFRMGRMVRQARCPGTTSSAPSHEGRSCSRGQKFITQRSRSVGDPLLVGAPPVATGCPPPEERARPERDRMPYTRREDATPARPDAVHPKGGTARSATRGRNPAGGDATARTGVRVGAGVGSTSSVARAHHRLHWTRHGCRELGTAHWAARPTRRRRSGSRFHCCTSPTLADRLEGGPPRDRSAYSAARRCCRNPEPG